MTRLPFIGYHFHCLDWMRIHGGTLTNRWSIIHVLNVFMWFSKRLVSTMQDNLSRKLVTFQRESNFGFCRNPQRSHRVRFPVRNDFRRLVPCHAWQNLKIWSCIKILNRAPGETRLGEAFGRVRAILDQFRNHFGHQKGALGSLFGSSKIDLECVLGVLGRVKAILHRFWSDLGGQNGGQSLNKGKHKSF